MDNEQMYILVTTYYEDYGHDDDGKLGNIVPFVG